MIQPNELRIGNWVIFGNRSALMTRGNCQLTGMIHTGAYYHDESEHKGIDYLLSYDDYSGIPITPEILEKAGFRKQYVLGSKTFEWYQKGELSYNESHGGWWYRGPIRFIKYVHTLQNLYFALTGEELEINL